MAAAVHPKLTYRLVEGANGQRWWISAGSKGLVADDAPVIREAPGSELVDLVYRGPFDELPAAAGIAHRVIPWSEVSDVEGTGIVHIAPGAGKEDFALSKLNDLPVIAPLNEFGDLYVQLLLQDVEVTMQPDGEHPHGAEHRAGAAPQMTRVRARREPYASARQPRVSMWKRKD